MSLHSVGATDFSFCQSAMVNPGPTTADLEKLGFTPMSGPSPDPLTVMAIYASTFNPDGTADLGQMLLIMPWYDLADLAASIAGTVETWPDDMRTAYLARVDRRIPSWRDARKNAPTPEAVEYETCEGCGGEFLAGHICATHRRCGLCHTESE